MISEFPLFAFTTLGGLAAGAYAAGMFFAPDEHAAKRPWLFPLVCLVLLGAGLLGVLGHLGRPERFLLALANPSAMIAQEAYWSIAFGVLVLIDLVLLARKGTSPRAVHVLAAVAAAGLMGIMGWAYFTAYGNPAWATWQTLPLFVVGDLAMGAALLTLFRDGLYRKAVFSITTVVLAVLTAISFALVGVHFVNVGYDSILFVVAAVLAMVGAAFGLLAWKGKLPEKVAPAFVFACVFVSVVVARYAFYAASVL